MRIFNRIVIILLLAGLFVLGVFTVLYSFDLAGYRLADLSRALRLDDFYRGLRGFVGAVERGNLNALDIATLVVIALLGLVLLVLELKPPAPRKVRMQQGTYITRGAVEDEAIAATEQNPEVLESNANAEARRRTGAKVNIEASVRRGENIRNIQSGVRDRVQQHLDRVGIPVSNLKVRIVESDPRETRARVK
ncbi:MAG: alkaline shock response membrane anchor protein AmaP [Actinomycetota bacterium]|nr:alkaline shock response membrane anchor protein AmaP [Actinomycetota bacterium]